MKIKKNISLLLTALLMSCSNGGQQQTNTPKEDATKAVIPVVTQQQKTEEVKQSGGTNFQNLSLEQAIDSAKVQGKLVFVNMHTKTCRPCRLMEKTIFPKEELGKYLNEHFISIIIDAEEGEGARINSRYGVSIYPTYLIIDTAATKLGEIIGAEKDINEFINKIDSIIKPVDSTHLAN